MNHEIKHRESESRGMFYMDDKSGIISQLTYAKKDNGVMLVDHTETKKSLEGQGLASIVLQHVVKYAREQNLKIDPLCPFVEVQFELHPEYRDVLVE